MNLITQLIALDQPIVPTRTRVIEAELAEAPQLIGTGPNMLTDNIHNLGSLINTPEPETTSGRESILVEID